MTRMPALSLAAVPGRRLRTIDLAPEIEKRGFAGIYGPSVSDVMSLCLSVAHVTETIDIGTSIQPIYQRHPVDLGQAASYLTEVSGGRFRLGLGVSHEVMNSRLGVDTGRPLTDMRNYVETIRKTVGKAPMPTIVLATLRNKMLALAAEIADGAVWANAARSHMAGQLASIEVSDDFFLGCMIPTVIDEDRDAARAIHRRTLSMYVALPNYRNYWIDAGYGEEMAAIKAALDAGDRETVPGLMSDRWLDDCTLSGSPTQVRDGIEAWFDAGVTTPIVVPSATSGGQLRALEQVFALYENG